jgi:non-homologous end joining protein Ku
MPEPPKVVDLMEALRKSLNAVSTEKKKPVKAEIKKTKAVARSTKAANGARKRKAG